MTPPNSTPIILGAPIVNDWSISLLVTCSCHTVLLVVGKMGVIFQCNRCQRMYCLTRLTSTPEGQLQVGISSPQANSPSLSLPLTPPPSPNG